MNNHKSSIITGGQMSSMKLFILSWRYTSKKGRLMLILGLIGMLSIFLGSIIILIGALSLFTIVGVPNPDTDNVFKLLFTGLGVCIVGVIFMVIYSIGMNFIPHPSVSEPNDGLD